MTVPETPHERPGATTAPPTASVRDPAAPVPPPRRPRGGGTTRDIVISLLVMALVIGGFLLVSGLWQNIRIGVGRPLSAVVDVSASAASAASTAPFPLVSPVGLPTGWTGRAAVLQGGAVWHVTYVTPAARYAAVDQSAGTGATVLDEVLPGRRAAGTVQLASGTWQRFTAASTADGAGRAGLVQKRGASTVVVSGTAGAAELSALAAALRTG